MRSSSGYHLIRGNVKFSRQPEQIHTRPAHCGVLAAGFRMESTTDSFKGKVFKIRHISIWAIARGLSKSVYSMTAVTMLRQATPSYVPLNLVSGPVAINGRSSWIPGSYAPAWAEKHNSFVKLFKKKGFKEESMTKVGLYAIGTSTTLNASRLTLRHSNTVGGSSHRLQRDGLPWKPQSLIGRI